MRRIVTRSVAGVVLLVAAAALGGYLYLRQSLPDYDADDTVAGLTGAVDIVRDADAIPHIFASNTLDGLFGLGYAHAQDRLWQMEFQRRVGHGRLSEVFGTATISQDRFLRTIGFGRAARSAWDRLPQDVRRQVEAYVAGVNAFIESHRGRRLPPEFTVLRVEPEPFTGPDVLVWVKMMAWDLSANYASELLRHDLLATVGPARMAELLPPYPPDGLSILNDQPRTHEAQASSVHLPGAPPAAPAAWASFEQMIGNGSPDRKSTRLNSSHVSESRMPSSA